MIISFSGIDSSGKSTQIKLLEKVFDKHGVKYRTKWGKVRGTPGIVFLKKIFRKDKFLDDEEKKIYRQKVYDSNFKRKLLLNLSLIDFALYFGIYYRILSCFYKYLICDRYIWDSYIEVQNEFSGIDLNKNLIWWFAKLIIPKPKYSFIFVIPAEVSLKRDIEKMDPTLEILDAKKKKIALYECLIKEFKWNYVINGMDPKEDIHNKIKEILQIDYQSHD